MLQDLQKTHKQFRNLEAMITMYTQLNAFQALPALSQYCIFKVLIP